MVYTYDELCRMEQAQLIKLIDCGELVLERDVLDRALINEIRMIEEDYCETDLSENQINKLVQTLHDDEWLWSTIHDRIRYHIDHLGKEVK